MPSNESRAVELRQKRAGLIHSAREITEAAEAEGRDFTAEEDASYKAMWSDIGELQRRAERIELEAREAAKLEALEDRSASGDDAGAPEIELKGVRPEIRSAVLALRESAPALFTEEYGRGFRAFVANGETRGLLAGSDPDGGFTVPAMFQAQMLEKVRDAVVIEQFATTTMLTTGDSIGRPTLETRPADADWTSELATGSEDTAMKFGKRELNPHPLAKRIKTSNKLLRASALPIESIITSNLAYKFGITREKAFMTGSGASQPLGLFTASADGIPTSRDMSTGNTTTAMTFDGLKNAKWNLKDGYRRNARWVFHRDALAQIDKLTDGNGAYLLQPDVRVGTGDVVMGRPVLASEYAPNTFTTGNYVGLFGDLSYYWIVDALTFTLQRLSELYAETNQTGFIGRAETDAMPTFGEAFTRVTLT